jgi:hypothetical protein
MFGIGVPGASFEGVADAGSVAVLANPGGGGVVIAYVSQGAGSGAEAGDRFGSSLAVGNFDDDSHAELVAGAPAEDVGAEQNAGEVRVLRGIGTSSIDVFQWTQDGVAGLESEAGDQFGSSFAVGDFDANGFDDLAIGIPGEDVGGAGTDFGAALVLFGTPSGLLPADAQLLPLGVVLVEPDVAFGWSLAAGRFSGHSGSDLAIGLPEVEVEGEPGAGAVRVYASIALFLDGFESGDATAWSQVAP